MAPHRESQLWSLGILATAAISFPYVLTCTLLLKLYHRLFSSSTTEFPAPTRTAIVTGGKMTKALCVCRQLKQSGCRVRASKTLSS